MDTASGERTILKVTSTPQAPEAAVLTVLDRLRELRPDARITSVCHSTTIATNALLGQLHLELPRLAFLTTQGFRDVIEIGRQNRSEVYNLFVTRPKPLVGRADRIGVRERIAADGTVLVPLADAEIERAVAQVRARGVQAVAIGFLHSYVNDAHERRLATALAAAMPDLAITCSAEIDPEYREYERFSTAVVNAALQPIVQGYLQRLDTALHERGIDAPLFVMQSSGGMGIASRLAARPAAMIESGPASGVIAAAELASKSGLERAISFDMGGTTAKAGTIADGVVQIAYEFEAAGKAHSGRDVKGSGYPVRFPFVDLAEISAGGGTIAWLDDAGALRVGPISAGADPGPACYGRSDRATVTDANLVLGKLNPAALAGGSFPIDAARAREAIATLAGKLSIGIEETAAGIVRIVDSQMAKVLRIVTVERGLDPRAFSLVAFGGNGPLHACALAEDLGVTRIVVPESPGVFSAFGLLVAGVQVSFVHPLMAQQRELRAEELETLFEHLEDRARAALLEQSVQPAAMHVARAYDARYSGQSFELNIEHAGDPADIAERFHGKHRARYGYAVPEEPIELVSARLMAVGDLEPLPARAVGAVGDGTHHPQRRDLWIDGRFQSIPILQRQDLDQTWFSEGPALVEQYDATTYVAPEWRASMDGDTLVMVRNA